MFLIRFSIESINIFTKLLRSRGWFVEQTTTWSNNYNSPPSPFENVRLYRVRRDWFQLNACPIFWSTISGGKPGETPLEPFCRSTEINRFGQVFFSFFFLSSSEKFYVRTYKGARTLPGHSFLTRDYLQFIVELTLFLVIVISIKPNEYRSSFNIVITIVKSNYQRITRK